jgi:DNA replication and repair protein RecF
MLSELFVRDFRCFAEGRLRPHPELTVLVGRNAQGKTSLLEAACVLLRLQSPRTASRTDLIRFGPATCLVEGQVGGHRLRFAQGARVRRLAVDGAVCTRSAEYLALSGRVVWMDHRDMGLLRGGAEQRRRYLDFAASQVFTDYLPALRGYERALRGRNHVLKRDAVIAWRQADAFAGVMDGFARILRGRRAELTAALAPEAAGAHTVLSGGAETAEVAYQSGQDNEDLASQLAGLRLEEQRQRVTLAGPHRDDLQLSLNGMDATAFASEGQQRSLAVAMKVAQARVLQTACGTPPLLLVDDVFGELDAHRRRALLALLPAGTQKILTTTSLDWAAADEVEGEVWRVEGASLQPA